MSHTEDDCRLAVWIGIPVLLVGGTEMQTLSLTRVLRGAGHAVTVCCYHEHDAQVVASFKDAGAEVILLGLERSAGGWALISALRKLLKSARPDVFHVQYMAPGLLPIVAARLARARRILATVHYQRGSLGLKAKLLLRFAARLCDVFLCVSRAAEESWFGDSCLLDGSPPAGRRHFTIYNMVDAPRIAALAQAGLDVDGLGAQDGPVVGMVSRLRSEKGPAVLLEAMAKVLEQVPSARLLIVGDGPDRAELVSLAESLGIASRVVWAGQRSAQEVFGLYGRMDVVAVPSLSEGFGLSAAEAMAAGKPVVASNVGGLPEVVRDGVTGLLVPPGDSAALAQVLVRLLQDPALARELGRAGQEHVVSSFSHRRYERVTLALYEDAQRT